MSRRSTRNSKGFFWGMVGAYRGARYCAAMRTRGRALPFAAAIAAALLALVVPAVALATTSEQLADRSNTTWLMPCTVNGSELDCSGGRHPAWHAVITPPSGQFTKLS